MGATAYNNASFYHSPTDRDPYKVLLQCRTSKKKKRHTKGGKFSTEYDYGLKKMGNSEHLGRGARASNRPFCRRYPEDELWESTPQRHGKNNMLIVSEKLDRPPPVIEYGVSNKPLLRAKRHEVQLMDIARTNHRRTIRNEFEIVAYAANVLTLDDDEGDLYVSNTNEFDDWEDLGKDSNKKGKGRTRGSYAQALTGG